MPTKISFDSLKRLEDYLSAKLQPIKPNPSFIQRLQVQLGNAKTVLMEKKSQTVAFFFIVFGVVAGAVILLLMGKPKTKKRIGI